MPITLQRSFDIAGAPDEVWEFLADPHRVVTCLPGARLLEEIDDHTFRGEIGVRVGPFGASFLGTITFEELDRDNLRVSMSGEGRDPRSRATVSMRMRSHLEPREDGGTSVLVDQELDLEGGIASLGQGILNGFAELLFGRFTGCVKQTIEGRRRS